MLEVGRGDKTGRNENSGDGNIYDENVVFEG